MREQASVPRLYSPKVTFPWIVRRPLYLDEVLVETQVVPDTVLPSTLCQAIVGEIIRDPLIDLCERKTVVVCSEYSHGYECSVAIRRSLFLAVELRDVSEVNNIEVAVAFVPLFGTEVLCIKSINNLR